MGRNEPCNIPHMDDDSNLNASLYFPLLSIFFIIHIYRPGNLTREIYPLVMRRQKL